MKRVKTYRDIEKEFNDALKPILFGFWGLVVVAAIVLIAGYYTYNTVQAMNKPAVEAAESTQPLNEGVGYLLMQIGAHWMETILIVMGSLIIIAYIKKRRNR